MSIDDDELPACIGARLRDDLYRIFRRETGPERDPEPARHPKPILPEKST